MMEEPHGRLQGGERRGVEKKYRKTVTRKLSEEKKDKEMEGF